MAHVFEYVRVTTSGDVVVDQRQRGVRRELAVGLVDDQERVVRTRHPEHGLHRRFVVDHAGRVVRRAEERDRRIRLAKHSGHLVEVDREVGGALAGGDRGAHDPGDVRVQCVGRFPHRGGATRPAVREQQCLEYFVRSVGGEDLFGRDAVQIGDAAAQLGGTAVGVAVPVDGGELVGQPLLPRVRGRVRRLVRVQPDGDVDLR